MTALEPTGSETERAADPFGWRFVAPLLMGSSLNPINSTLISVALVPIARDFGIPVGRTAVIVAALYVACAVAQPVAGKLAEELGPRRIFLIGIAAVLVGGAVGSVAENIATLVVARVLIGAGTSAGYPSAMLIIRRRAMAAGLSSPPGGVLGGISIAGNAPIALGPPIGGALVVLMGWRAAFLINIPLALATLVCVIRWLPADEAGPARRRARDVVASLDVIGMTGFGAAVTVLLLALLSLPSTNWVAITGAVGLIAALWAWELHATKPFFDVRQLAGNRGLSITYLRAVIMMVGVYAVLSGLTQWLQAGRGLSAAQAGLLILPVGVLATVIVLPIAPRNLIRLPLVGGALVMIAASSGALFLTKESPAIWIVVIGVAFGAAIGAQLSGNQSALYAQAPAEQLGTASGLYRTFCYLGSILSSTVVGVIFRSKVTDSGLHTIAWILLGSALFTLVIAILDRRLKTSAPL